MADIINYNVYVINTVCNNEDMIKFIDDKTKLFILKIYDHLKLNNQLTNFEKVEKFRNIIVKQYNNTGSYFSGYLLFVGQNSSSNIPNYLYQNINNYINSGIKDLTCQTIIINFEKNKVYKDVEIYKYFFNKLMVGGTIKVENISTKIIESIKKTLIDPYFNEKIRIKVYKKSIDIIKIFQYI